jgi:diaminopimelate decarboxylase
VLAFLDTGAYQEASASNFNALPRPATVLVSGAGAEIVKTAEHIDDIFARGIVPTRLADAPQATERHRGAVAGAGATRANIG